MAKRTVTNVTTEHTIEIGNLIRDLPFLFNRSGLIGIFEGLEICSSFLLNSDYLERITFYENLEFTENKKVKEYFIELYNKWQTEIPNLNVLIEDGNNFTGTFDFLFIDTTIPLTRFINDNKSKLKNIPLSASPGWGVELNSTIEMCNNIIKGDIYPVFVYKDYLFYSFNMNASQLLSKNLTNYYKDKDNYRITKNYFLNSHMYYIYDHPTSAKGTYHDQIKPYQ